jgi:hypothetical protein
MSSRNTGIERSEIEITNFSILTENICNKKITVVENKKYKYKTKFREYLAVEGTLINNSDVLLQNIRVDVIFLDKQDNIIDLNSNIVKNLPPGESGKFIVFIDGFFKLFVFKKYIYIFGKTKRSKKWKKEK